jgi:hypothetical protein
MTANPTYALSTTLLFSGGRCEPVGMTGNHTYVPFANPSAPRVPVSAWHLESPGYADSSADTAPGTDPAEAVGYALLSRDHKRDPEVHGPPDARLHSGDAVPKPRLAAASESGPVYTMLDGTHRLSARHEMNAATTGGGHVEPLPGTHADISIELSKGAYAAPTNPVSGLRLTHFQASSRYVPGTMAADEEA